MICLCFCLHWIRTALRVRSDYCHPKTRNLRSIISQRIFRIRYSRKKMGFAGMITSVPFMTDKMTLTAFNITREKRACWLQSPSCILCCPEVHWSLWHETVCVAFCLIWRPVGQTLMYWLEMRPHGSLDFPVHLSTLYLLLHSHFPSALLFLL